MFFFFVYVEYFTYDDTCKTEIKNRKPCYQGCDGCCCGQGRACANSADAELFLSANESTIARPECTLHANCCAYPLTSRAPGPQPPCHRLGGSPVSSKRVPRAKNFARIVDAFAQLRRSTMCKHKIAAWANENCRGNLKNFSFFFSTSTVTVQSNAKAIKLYCRS